jgi:hypothetical protein
MGSDEAPLSRLSQFWSHHVTLVGDIPKGKKAAKERSPYGACQQE